MNDNQRQDWWPENDTDSSNNSSNIPSDSASQENSENYQQPEDRQPDQKNEWNNYSYQETTNDGWSSGSYQNIQNNGWNNDPGQNGQNNGWNNNLYQNGQYNGWNQTPYQTPNRSPLRSTNSMAAASLVMGILSVVLICCGFSFCFGALGIIFALLSRRNGPMEPQAKAGLGLSIGGTVIGIALIIFLTIGNSQYSEILQEYERFYNEYEDDYFDDGIFENYYENLPFENNFPDDNNLF